MNQDPVRVKTIDWLAAVPDLHVAKSLRFGYRCRTILPAAAAVLIVALLVSVWRDVGTWSEPVFRQYPVNFLDLYSLNPARAITGLSWVSLTDKPHFFGALVALSFVLFVTATAAVAISRGVACEFCLQQRSGVIANFRYACRHWLTNLWLTAAMIVLLIVCLIALVFIQTVAAALPSGLWALPAVLMAILIFATWLTLMVSAPLAVAAIAVDECGAADALSRAISYVLSHKLRAAWLVCLSLALAVTAGIIAIRFCVNGQVLIFTPETPFIIDHSKIVIAATVQFAVLQAAFTIAYLLLRKTEDGVSLRELGGQRG